MAYEEDKAVIRLWKESKARSLAVALSELDRNVWRSVPHDYEHACMLKCDSDRCESLWLTIRDGRVHISGSYRQMPDGRSWSPSSNYQYQAENPSASVAADRPAMAIAKDIKRKILDGGYRFYLDKQKEQATAQDANYMRAVAVGEQVAKAYGQVLTVDHRKSLKEGRSVTFYDYIDGHDRKPELEVSSYGSLKVKAFDLQPEFIPQLLELWTLSYHAARAQTKKEG